MVLVDLTSHSHDVLWYAIASWILHIWASHSCHVVMKSIIQPSYGGYRSVSDQMIIFCIMNDRYRPLWCFGERFEHYQSFNPCVFILYHGYNFPCTNILILLVLSWSGQCFQLFQNCVKMHFHASIVIKYGECMTSRVLILLEITPKCAMNTVIK